MTRLDFAELSAAIKQLFGQDQVPLHVPLFQGNEKKYVNDTLDSQQISSTGSYLDQLESSLAEITQTSSAVAMVNGTSALQLALQVVGVKGGEEVITQALTFIATANAIAYNQAYPVFVDVDADTMGMSPRALKAFFEEFAEIKPSGTYNKLTGRRIAACVPVHSFGFMCRIDEIVAICQEWNIPIVEDAAEALGSSLNNKPAGSFGSMGVFSFNGNKIVTSGGGGAIVSNNTADADKARFLSMTARDSHAFEYNYSVTGYNFRMPNFNAALLCAQLEQLEFLKESKKKLYADYQSLLQKIEGIELLAPPNNTDWNHWLVTVKCESKAVRDALLQATNENGVVTRPVWKLMHHLPMFENCQKDGQHNARHLEELIVNLPSSPRKA